MSTPLQISKIMFVDSTEKTVSAVIKYIQNFDVQTDFYSEIVVLFELYLVSPETKGVSEQSACLVRHVKKMAEMYSVKRKIE